MKITFEAELWIWHGNGGTSWHFVSLPEALADEIEAQAGTGKPGFGAVRVEARIGLTVWKTSIFPSSEQATYILPVKKAVRRAQSLEAGDTVTVRLEVGVS